MTTDDDPLAVLDDAERLATAALLPDVDPFVISGYALRWSSTIDAMKGSTQFDKRAFGSAPLRVPLLYQHVDADPLGFIVVVPDAVGLRAEGRIANTTRGRDVVALMKTGGLSGLSIGFNEVKAHSGGSVDRIVDQATLLEVSVVTFPGDAAARISSVGGQAVPAFFAASPREVEFAAASRTHEGMSAHVAARLAEAEAMYRRAMHLPERTAAPEVRRDMFGRDVSSRLAREGLAHFRLCERLRLDNIARARGVHPAVAEVERLAGYVAWKRGWAFPWW